MFAFIGPGETIVVGLVGMLLLLGTVGGVTVVLLVAKAARKNGGTANPNLRPCPDCGRKISTSAQTCPGCGRPLAS
jgi:hypothetical protein